VWRRRELSYDPTSSTASRRDFDHVVCYEPEFFIYRGNTTTLRYGKRPKRCDDERCERVVGYLCCISRHGLINWLGHLGSRRYGHNHCGFWIGDGDCIGNSYRNTSGSMLID
jgi:hypothetical protein